MNNRHINEELLRAAEGFTREKWPRLLCPRCGQGALKEQSGGEGVSLVPAAECLRWRDDHPGWEPEWTYGYFHGVLVCSDDDCGEPVVVSGGYKVECRCRAGGPDEDEWEIDYAEILTLRQSVPAPRLMEIPKVCPDSVKDCIDSAANVLWVDPASAANRLRSAIEKLLDSQGIPRVRNVETSRGPVDRPISTHDRITKFKEGEPEAAKLLEAVKWIGNSGSHEGSMEIEHVLTAVSLLEYVLNELYDNKKQKLADIATKINSSKGPVGSK
jgi:hypothetical protein